MNHDDYFDYVNGIIGDMVRLRITIDNITEATNKLPDYIIIPSSWGLTGKSIMDIPVLRADVPDLVAGYLAVPKSSPGPHTDTQTPQEERCHAYYGTGTGPMCVNAR